MLSKILAALDLSDDEVRIYVRLLEAGATTAGVLAKNLKLVRPTVYKYLHQMCDKGVLKQSVKEGVRVFMVEPPSILEQAFEKKIRDLQGTRDKLVRLLPDLERRMAQQFMEPKFHIFEGAEAVRNTLMDILLYRNIETYSFWSVQESISLLSPEFFRFHNAERVVNGLSLKTIWPRRQMVDLKRYPYMGSGKQNLREVRIAPKTVAFSMSYWIYASKVAFVSSSRECYGFVVESAEMAELMKTQHQLTWGLSEPLPEDPKTMASFLANLQK